MNTCYIIGAGEVHSLNFAPDETDIVICADGGLNYARQYGIKPDLVVGDFDSFGSIPEDEVTIVHPREKDFTDSSLAYECGKEKGYKNFELYGMLGGRLDHSFSNFELLSCIVNEGNTAVAYGTGFKVYMLKDSSAALQKKDSGIVSIFSFSEESTGINIKGLKYEVEDFTMTNRLTRGLSNEYVGKNATVSVKCGQLIIFEENYNG